MYSQEGLRYAITGLFCSRMGEDGYTMQEAEGHLEIGRASCRERV